MINLCASGCIYQVLKSTIYIAMPFIFTPLYKGFSTYSTPIRVYIYIYWPMALWVYKLHVPNMVLEP